MDCNCLPIGLVCEVHARVKFEYVSPHTVDSQFKMQMISATVARGADITDDLSFTNGISLVDYGHLALVGIQSDLSVTMVNSAVVTVGRGIFISIYFGHYPIITSVDWCTRWGRNIGAGVVIIDTVQNTPAK